MTTINQHSYPFIIQALKSAGNYAQSGNKKHGVADIR